MTSRHFILGTAGHIDHGKSTLVRALTGTDPDRLPEEKSRGMTIELGFAHLSLPDPEVPETTFELGLVDVPGHADFVKNMVAGVGSVDLALFVVAADDSWMPQSEEHFQILHYLGVKRAIVALTKADLAEDIEFVAEDVATYLEGTAFADAPVVPVSALKGDGMDDLKATIARLLRDAPDPQDTGKPRLPVDRAFSPTGVGSVVTGTLGGGGLAAGQAVVIQPSGTKTKVRGIQTHKTSSDSIPPGTRTALNLADAPLASRSKRDGLQRGDTITLPGTGSAVDTIDVTVTRSTREIAGQTVFESPIKDGSRIRFHHGSADIPARIFFLDQKRLASGETAFAELRFDSPVYAFAGDGFVLRDWAKRGTVAGGTILDPDARPRRFRKPEQRAFLEAVAATPGDAGAFLGAILTRDDTLDPEALAKTPFSEDDASAAIDAAVAAGTAVRHGNFVASKSWWDAASGKLADAVRAQHRDFPERTSLSFNSLRSKMPRNTAPALFDLLIADLTANGFVRTPAGLRDSAHTPELPANLAPLRAPILAALNSNPTEPPSPGEFVTSADQKKVVKFLVDIGEVVELSEKCIILTTALEELQDRVKNRLASGPATASEIRELLGTTRRILIPLLEKMDSDGTTIRDGDNRTLK